MFLPLVYRERPPGRSRPWLVTWRVLCWVLRKLSLPYFFLAEWGSRPLLTAAPPPSTTMVRPPPPLPPPSSSSASGFAGVPAGAGLGWRPRRVVLHCPLPCGPGEMALSAPCVQALLLLNGGNDICPNLLVVCRLC